MSGPFRCFTDQTQAFLRRLRRHNNREWFRLHRDEFERDVRGPMISLIERLASDFREFAPELAASPRASLYRIHRDTRFSPDKSPYKTHVAAVFPHRDLPRHRGAGLYLEVTPDRVLVGGGIYAPEPADLQRVRAHLASRQASFRVLVESPAFRRAFGGVEGRSLQRVPRGYPADHPAGAYLKLRQLLAGCEYPAALATSPRFYRTVVTCFRQLAPFIRFLNDPLVAGLEATAAPLAAGRRRPSRLPVG
jgi:uncharacterized protein (TIGR02453 family)